MQDHEAASVLGWGLCSSVPPGNPPSVPTGTGSGSLRCGEGFMAQGGSPWLLLSCLA